MAVCLPGRNPHPFHFGRTLTTDQANYKGPMAHGQGATGQYRQKTVPVGSLPANPWGLYEVHGNVWEQCQDWYGEYAAGPVTNPIGPVTGRERVLRGGSWFSEARNLRSVYRFRNAPGNRSGSIGFPLALGPKLGQARPAG
jgi:formylglycine-generating enzyme required for sulfatase activity